MFAHFLKVFRAKALTRQEDIATFKQAITIEPDPDYYPNFADVRVRLEATNMFEPSSIEWLASMIHNGLVETEGYNNICRAIRSEGVPLTKDEKRSKGIRANTIMGDRFVSACRNSDYKAANKTIMLVAQNASSQAILKYNQRKFIEAGITHCKLLNCNDERDCAASHQHSDTIFLVEDMALPLPDCDAEYCRCTFTAVVKNLD